MHVWRQRQRDTLALGSFPALSDHCVTSVWLRAHNPSSEACAAMGTLVFPVLVGAGLGAQHLYHMTRHQRCLWFRAASLSVSNFILELHCDELQRRMP